MIRHSLDILYEDNHVLAVNKPAVLATMGAEIGQPSLFDQAKQYIKDRYHKPGNVYLGVVSRLDAFVTGAVVFAKTSKAAQRLCQQFREREVEKTYWAVVQPPPKVDDQTVCHWLRKNDSLRCMQVATAHESQAQEARLRYHVHARRGRHALLQIELETGRKHQIRVQCQAIGSPILGDRKYGSRDSFPRGIALHARSVTFSHPTRREAIRIVAGLPEYWPYEDHEWSSAAGPR